MIRRRKKERRGREIEIIREVGRMRNCGIIKEM